MTLKHHTRGLFCFQVPENSSNRNAPFLLEEGKVKSEIIAELMKMNSEVRNEPIVSVNLLPLLKLREKSLKDKNHVYSVFLKEGYIKNPHKEFLY